MFAAQHDASSTALGKPGLVVGLNLLGQSYILHAGDMGYVRKGLVAPLIAAGDLEAIEGASEFPYPIYTFYPKTGEA